MSDGQVAYLPERDHGHPHRLGRNINHDPRNREFPARRVQRRAVPTTDVRHRVYGALLDQGNLGACTGFAGAEMLNAHPYRAHFNHAPTFGNSFAVELYAATTLIDPFPGEYPPNDTGSDGGSVCKELRNRGTIAGYEWAFGLDNGLNTIRAAPYMQGTYWFEDMFTPSSTGHVHPTGALAGGHEYLWQGVEITGRILGHNRSWFRNCWGPWGYNARGYFWMTWDEHRELLDQSGDLVRAVRW